MDGTGAQNNIIMWNCAYTINESDVRFQKLLWLNSDVSESVRDAKYRIYMRKWNVWRSGFIWIMCGRNESLQVPRDSITVFI